MTRPNLDAILDLMLRFNALAMQLQREGHSTVDIIGGMLQEVAAQFLEHGSPEAEFCAIAAMAYRSAVRNTTTEEESSL